jgi:hypothetical protein
MDRRPPAPVRYLVLFAAIVCLTCAVCVRASAPPPEQQGDAPPGQPATEQAAMPPADTGVAATATATATSLGDTPATPAAAVDAGATQAAEPPPPEPEFFPASKAPGRMF